MSKSRLKWIQFVFPVFLCPAMLSASDPEYSRAENGVSNEIPGHYSEEEVAEKELGVSSLLAVDGVIETTSGGVRFPDGTLQTTAANAEILNDLRSLTTNSGLYSNRIPDVTPPFPYVEVCFKNGTASHDIHLVSEPTSVDGVCDVDDIGWIIEIDERPALAWELAKVECLAEGMRLPEVFEYKFSCKNANLFGLNDMIDAYEWSSNLAIPVEASADGVGTVVIGSGSCSKADRGWIANTANTEALNEFRCVR